MRRGLISVLVFASCLLFGLSCSGDEDVSRAATPPEGPVYIESISPGSGTIGTEVVIRGFGFDAEENDIAFSGPAFGGRDVAYKNYVTSPEGETLRFELEDTLGLCAFSTMGPTEVCPSAGVFLPIGELTVSVVNGAGSSNGVVLDRKISRLEAAEDEIAESVPYQKMWQGLNDAVNAGSVSFGAGVNEDDHGEIYIDVIVTGMADTEVREIVPEEIDGYEVRVTKGPAPNYQR